jgi:uncharacterized protein YndB with AHSA1/START domain
MIIHAVVVIGVLIFLLVVVLIGIGATKPNTFRVERSVKINAPAEKVFGLINDFHEWTKWSPWETIDADLKREYTGAPAGKGAAYAWEGKKAGMGAMLITDSQPSSLILIKLDFVKPMVATNTTEFALSSEGGATTVRWSMFGPMPLMHRVMSTFMSMDKMVGGQFEAGLAKMKGVVEA